MAFDTVLGAVTWMSQAFCEDVEISELRLVGFRNVLNYRASAFMFRVGPGFQSLGLECFAFRNWVSELRLLGLEVTKFGPLGVAIQGLGGLGFTV